MSASRNSRYVDPVQAFRSWKQLLLSEGATLPDEALWTLVGELSETLERLRVEITVRQTGRRQDPPSASLLDDNRLAYSPTEFAKLTGLSRAKVHEMLAAGEIPARRAGRRWLIARGALNQWLSEVERELTRRF